MEKINIQTILAIIIILALAAFMAVIIVLQIAPTAGIAQMITSVVAPEVP
jgi:hypothetical protein